jgi:hypothetical protein
METKVKGWEYGLLLVPRLALFGRGKGHMHPSTSSPSESQEQIKHLAVLQTPHPPMFPHQEDYAPRSWGLMLIQCLRLKLEKKSIIGIISLAFG